MKKLFLVIFLYSISLPQTWCQNNNSSFIDLQLDRSTYIQGQTVFFNLINENYSLFERQYVALINHEKRILKYFAFSQSEEELYSGSFSLPEKLENGTYYFLWTDLTKYIVIPINIGQQTLRKNEVKNINNETEFEVHWENGELKLNVESSRDIQYISLKLYDRDFYYSSPSLDSISWSSQLPKPTNSNNFTFIQSETLIDPKIAISQYQNNKLVDIKFPQVVDKRFSHTIREEKEILVLDANMKGIDVINNDSSLVYAVLENIKLPKMEKEFERLARIEELTKRVRIWNSYIQEEKLIEKKNKLQNFVSHYDYVVKVGEFYSFENFRSLTKEILPWVKLKSSKGTFSLFIDSNNYNHHIDRKSTTLYNYQSLALLNGQVIFDHNNLANISPQTIDSISVYLNKIIVDGRFYNGVMNITTKPNVNLDILNANNLFRPSGENHSFKQLRNSFNEPNFYPTVYFDVVKIKGHKVFNHSIPVGEYLPSRLHGSIQIYYTDFTTDHLSFEVGQIKY